MAITRRITPTISTGAYADGDVIGGELSIAVDIGIAGFLNYITILDKDGESAPIDFFFFATNLDGTYTDNAAFALDSADEDKLLFVLTVVAADYVAVGADSLATVSPSIPLGLSPSVAGDNDLVAVGVIRAIHTFTATTDLQLTFGVSK